MSISSEQFQKIRESGYIDCSIPEINEAHNKYLQEIEDARNPEDTVIIVFKGLLPTLQAQHRSYWPPKIHCDLGEGYDMVQCKIRHEKEVVQELRDSGMKVIGPYYDN